MSVRRHPKQTLDPIYRDVWIIDYYDAQGVRHRPLFSGPEAEAWEWHDTLVAREQRGPVAAKPTVNQALAGFFAYLKNNGRSEATIRDYTRSMRHILNVFGPLKPAQITPLHVEQFKALRQGRNRSINKELAILSSLIGYMVKMGQAEALKFRLEKVKHKPTLPNPPAWSEYQKFLAEIREADKLAMIRLMCESGLRWKEARLIRWRDIGMDEVKIVGKGGKERFAILPPGLIWPKRTGFEYVFINPTTGKPYKEIKTLFAAACRRAGVERFTPHKLRHAFGCALLESSGDIELVKEALGHSDIRTAEIYAKVTQTRLKAALGRLAQERQSLVGTSEPRKRPKLKRI